MGNYYLLGAQLPSLRLDAGVVAQQHTPAEFLALHYAHSSIKGYSVTKPFATTAG